MSTNVNGDLEVVPATPEQQPVLANLIELYAHDFSEFFHLEIGEDGRFGYPPLSLYWSEPGRYPFLVRVDGNLAGLVLVTRDRDKVWDMAEFFILRAYRKRGIGTRVAHEVWTRFPGLWQVRVMNANVSGRRFWADAVARFAGDGMREAEFVKGGRPWTVFSFEAKSC